MLTPRLADWLFFPFALSCCFDAATVAAGLTGIALGAIVGAAAAATAIGNAASRWSVRIADAAGPARRSPNVAVERLAPQALCRMWFAAAGSCELMRTRPAPNKGGVSARASIAPVSLQL